MTRWGALLLLMYVALGVSGVESRRAVHATVWVTVVIIAAAALKAGAL